MFVPCGRRHVMRKIKHLNFYRLPRLPMKIPEKNSQFLLNLSMQVLQLRFKVAHSPIPNPCSCEVLQVSDFT